MFSHFAVRSFFNREHAGTCRNMPQNAGTCRNMPELAGGRLAFIMTFWHSEASKFRGLKTQSYRSVGLILPWARLYLGSSNKCRKMKNLGWDIRLPEHFHLYLSADWLNHDLEESKSISYVCLSLHSSVLLSSMTQLLFTKHIFERISFFPWKKKQTVQPLMR